MAGRGGAGAGGRRPPRPGPLGKGVHAVERVSLRVGRPGDCGLGTWGREVGDQVSLRDASIKQSMRRLL